MGQCRKRPVPVVLPFHAAPRSDVDAFIRRTSRTAQRRSTPPAELRGSWLKLMDAMQRLALTYPEAIAFLAGAADALANQIGDRRCR